MEKLEQELESGMVYSTYEAPGLVDHIIEEDRIYSYFELKTKEEYSRLRKEPSIYGYYVNCREHEDGYIEYKKTFYFYGHEFSLGKGSVTKTKKVEQVSRYNSGKRSPKFKPTRHTQPQPNVRAQS